MTFLLSPKVGLTIVLFYLMRVIDADPSFKGVIFIVSCLILIYLSQKNYSKKLFIYILGIFLIFIFANEKKKIDELSFPLKLSQNNEIFYSTLLGNEKFRWIKNHYINLLPECYTEKNSCFRNSEVTNYIISPDQLIFDIDFLVSRHVNEINFTNLANSRLSFINPSTGDIDPKKFINLTLLFMSNIPLWKIFLRFALEDWRLYKIKMAKEDHIIIQKTNVLKVNLTHSQELICLIIT